jgi:hypothetical protein
MATRRALTMVNGHPAETPIGDMIDPTTTGVAALTAVVADLQQQLSAGRAGRLDHSNPYQSGLLALGA